MSSDSSGGFAHAFRAWMMPLPISLSSSLSFPRRYWIYTFRSCGDILFVATNVKQSAAFTLPRGNFPISRRTPPRASPFLAVSVILKQVSPRDCSETDERSHFFYLLILICGCLKPIPPDPSSTCSSRLVLPYVQLVLLPYPRRFSVDLPFSLTELHAQCSQSVLLSLALFRTRISKCICARVHVCVLHDSVRI